MTATSFSKLNLQRFHNIKFRADISSISNMLQTMNSLSFFPEPQRSVLIYCPRILDWAHKNCRILEFKKNDRIPTRPGLLYLVHNGFVQLNSTFQISTTSQRPSQSINRKPEETLISIVGAGQPFEVVSSCLVKTEACAHIDPTSVMWMDKSDLHNWPYFEQEISEVRRHQHQYQQMLTSALGQRRIIDRLLGLLTVLVKEHGQPVVSEENPKVMIGYKLPYTLTHEQIASVLGATRVTITRLMGKLQARRTLLTQIDNSICLPVANYPQSF